MKPRAMKTEAATMGKTHVGATSWVSVAAATTEFSNDIPLLRSHAHARWHSRRARPNLAANLAANLPRTAHNPLRAGQFAEPHRPAGVQFLGRDADFGAESELAAVGEPGRGVDHDDRGVDLGEESLGVREVVRHDRFGVV